jgi:uncharacterized integral membrane protein (TIGR00698 family)
LNDARLPDIGFESYDSMEGLIAIDRSAPPARFGSWPGAKLIHAVYPGLLVAGTIALASTWLAQHYTAPVMLFALLFGMAFHFLHEEGRCVPGIEFSSKAILRTGVALLGARITVEQMLALGAVPIVMVVVGVASTLLVGFAASRALGLSRSFGVLSGGAVGICGASAAMAIAVAWPRKDSERDTVVVIACITTYSTVAMVLYPALISHLHWDALQTGRFLGGSIHDVAQVVAAGYATSPQAGDSATIVKLMRVTMLLPVVLIVTLLAARGSNGHEPAQKKVALLPGFLIAFVVLAALNGFSLVATPLAAGLTEASKWLLVISVAALGMKTSLRDMMAVGTTAIALIAAETIFLALLVLCWVTLIGR